MAILERRFDKAFFKKIDGKIIKRLEIKNGEKFYNIRAAVGMEHKDDVDIAVLPGDQKIPGLIRVVNPQDVVAVELFNTKKEMLDVLMTFDLRSPSAFLELLIDDFSSIKRRKMFDNELSEYIGADAIKRLSAALWLIEDPNLEKRFARNVDIE